VAGEIKELLWHAEPHQLPASGCYSIKVGCRGVPNASLIQHFWCGWPIRTGKMSIVKGEVVMIGKNLVAGSLLLLPVVAFAQESKPFSVGLASFSTSVDYTVEYEYGLDDDEEQTFSGPAIFWYGCRER
jgi:hypothetical protein